ncbi:MAG: hypothetical protein OEY50_06905 [Nitrospinota bacterium]|nr:hypothetical protein [Nitrospinota bacterium]
MELDQKGAFNNKPQLAFSSRSKVRDWVLAGFDLRYTYYSDSEGGSAAPEQKTQEENAARLFSSNLAEPAPADPGPADAFKQSGGRFELSWFLGAALKNWESSTFPVFGMNFVSEPNKDTNGSVQSASNYFLAYRFRVDRYGSLVGGTMTNANGWVQGGIKSTNIAWDEPFKLSSGKVFIEGEMDAYGGESSKLRLRLLAEVPMDKERQVDGLTNDTRIFISFLWSFDPLESRVFSRD